MQRLLLLLRLEDLLTIELELAIGITESISICGGEIRSVKHIDTKFTHVVDTLARVQLHIDRNVFQTDSNLAGIAVTIA